MAVKKKILLFGFSALPEILAVAAAAERFGAETVNVPGDRCGQTLERLAAEGMPPACPGSAPGGRMLVFCGLDRDLDPLLAALRQAGISGIKAVLTPANRAWTPARLYRELLRERRAMGG